MRSGFMRSYPLALAIAVILFALLAAVPAGYAQKGEEPKDPPKGNMSGKWKLTFSTPEGPEDATLDLKMVSDGSLSGTLTGNRGNATISSGYLSGDKFSFITSFSIEDTPTEVVFTGTFDGTTLNGTIAVIGYEIDFTGTRSTPETAALAGGAR